jgi:hypothetical protein
MNQVYDIGKTLLETVSKEQIEDLLRAIRKCEWAYQEESDAKLIRIICRDEIAIGGALRYLRQQWPEVCLAAIRQSGFNLEWCKKQTKEMIQEAAKDIGWVEVRKCVKSKRLQAWCSRERKLRE